MATTTIPFTQYLRPNGQPRPMLFDAPPELCAKAAKVIAAGLRFEAEVLTTGEVSLTVYDPQIEEDIDIQVCTNGPGIEKAVEALVNAAAVIIGRSK